MSDFMFRGLVLLLLTILSFSVVAKPQRIVSVGLCTDQLLLMLAERDQIASVSNWVLDERMSYMHAAVGDIPINHASIEEIIRLKPDLVIASEFVARDTTRLLKQLGYPVVRFLVPNSMDETYQLIEEFGRHTGNLARAQETITAMRTRLAEIQARYQTRPEKTFIIYGPNGYTIGANTLENDIFIHAGYRNLAAEMGIEGFQSISLEELVVADPDVLQIDLNLSQQQALATSHLTHPVIEKIIPRGELLDIPLNLRICAGPMITEAVEMMAKRR